MFRTRHGYFTVTKVAEVFEFIVGLQDSGMSVSASRKAAMSKYQLTHHRIVWIEEVGINRQWYPLNQAPLRQGA